MPPTAAARLGSRYGIRRRRRVDSRRREMALSDVGAELRESVTRLIQPISEYSMKFCSSLSRRSVAITVRRLTCVIGAAILRDPWDESPPTLENLRTSCIWSAATFVTVILSLDVLLQKRSNLPLVTRAHRESF